MLIEIIQGPNLSFFVILGVMQFVNFFVSKKLFSHQSFLSGCQQNFYQSSVLHTAHKFVYLVAFPVVSTHDVVPQPITVPLTKSGSYICHLTCSSCSTSQIFGLCLFFLHTLEIRVVKQKFYDKVEESKYQYPHQLKLLCNVLLLPGLSEQARAMQQHMRV